MITRPAKNVRRHAALGLGLAALFLVGQVSGFTHLLLVRHATCLAHGELIHLGPSAPTASPAPDKPSYAAAPQPAEDHGDEHCLVAMSRREKPAASTSLASSIALTPGPAAAVTERAVLTPRSLALLRLAPKSSPPV